MGAIWGGRGGETTCRVSGHTKETRIDYVIVNDRLWPSVRGVAVDRTAGFKTHFVVQLLIDTRTEDSQLLVPSKIGSLADLAKNWVQERKSAEKEEKVKARIKAHIDDKLKEAEADLCEARGQRNTNKLWKVWSKAVEVGWLNAISYLDWSTKRKMMGRGGFVARMETMKKRQPKHEDDLKTNAK